MNWRWLFGGSKRVYFSARSSDVNLREIALTRFWNDVASQQIFEPLRLALDVCESHDEPPLLNRPKVNPPRYKCGGKGSEYSTWLADKILRGG